jgi:SAM-dependent methyltransferase
MYRFLAAVRYGLNAFRALAYRGHRVFCPCCRHWFGRFKIWDPTDPNDENRVCPRCGAHSRHRAMVLYLENNPALIAPSQKMLHFAPEYCLWRIFKHRLGLTYVTADLNAPLADVHTDLTALQFADREFDLVLCLHVLEHIPDDLGAMRELHRVLKPGGTALAQVPIDPARAVTFENAAITSPAERLRIFGQADHVRICGNDYHQRLVTAGFKVTIIDVSAPVDAAARVKYGLMSHEPFYVCRKPE